MTAATACAEPISEPDIAPAVLPTDIRAALTSEQIARLEDIIADRRAVHAVDYRASSSFCGRHFYLTLFLGPENRSLRRLRTEGQRRTLYRVLAEVAGFCMTISMLTCLIVGAAVIVLYVTKSALGIDLMQGHSMLHDYFYWR